MANWTSCVEKISDIGTYQIFFCAFCRLSSACFLSCFNSSSLFLWASGSDGYSAADFASAFLLTRSALNCFNHIRGLRNQETSGKERNTHLSNLLSKTEFQYFKPIQIPITKQTVNCIGFFQAKALIICSLSQSFTSKCADTRLILV